MGQKYTHALKIVFVVHVLHFSQIYLSKYDLSTYDKAFFIYFPMYWFKTYYKSFSISCSLQSPLSLRGLESQTFFLRLTTDLLSGSLPEGTDKYDAYSRYFWSILSVVAYKRHIKFNIFPMFKGNNKNLLKSGKYCEINNERYHCLEIRRSKVFHFILFSQKFEILFVCVRRKFKWN